MRPGEGSTVIGRSATFRGDLSSTEDLQIDGTFEGTIRLSSGRLTVGLEARVKASIAAAVSICVPLRSCWAMSLPRGFLSKRTQRCMAR